MNQKLTNKEKKELSDFNDLQVTTHYNETRRMSTKLNKLVDGSLSVRATIMIAITCTMLTTLLMALWQWNIGYTFSRQIGAVPSDTLSGSAMYEQLKSEIEVNHLLRGLILDDVSELNLAKSIIRVRSDGEVRGAQFSKDLTRKEKIQFILMASRLNQINALEWVKNQPNWSDGLSKRTMNLVAHEVSDEEFFAVKKSFMHMGKPESKTKTASNSF